MFVEGVLWIVRKGSPWPDLREVYGDWNSVLRRFSAGAARAYGRASSRRPSSAPTNTRRREKRASEDQVSNGPLIADVCQGAFDIAAGVRVLSEVASAHDGM